MLDRWMSSFRLSITVLAVPACPSPPPALSDTSGDASTTDDCDESVDVAASMALTAVEIRMDAIEAEVDGGFAEIAALYATQSTGPELRAALAADFAAHVEGAPLFAVDLPVQCGGTLVPARGSAGVCQPDVNAEQLTYTCAGWCALDPSESGACAGELQCRGMLGDCPDKCVGTCELEVAASCFGDCIGACDGECRREGPQGCVGPCEGSCQGTCVGVGLCLGICSGYCTITGASAASECDGAATWCAQAAEACSLDCDGLPTTTQLTPACDRVAALASVGQMTCEPPFLVVRYGISAAVDEMAAEEFQQRLADVESFLALMFRISRELELVAQALEYAQGGIELPCDLPPFDESTRVDALETRRLAVAQRIADILAFVDS